MTRRPTRQPTRPLCARDRDLIDRFLRIRSTRFARGTAAEYRADLTWFAGSLGRHTLRTATPDDVAIWITAHLRDEDDPADRRPWSLRTAHRRHASLRSFYQWANREGLVARNPVDSVELPRFYRRPARIVPLTEIERIFTDLEARIAATTDSPDRALFCLDVILLRLMERLALRVSEAAGIRLSRLTTVDGELRAWITKKGHKPKSYPITGVVLSAFVRWLESRNSLSPESGHEDFAFVHPTTRRRVTRNQIQIRLRKLARAAGLSPTTVAALSPHKLRHARARAMLQSGFHIAAVQAVLDHASIQTTQVYIEDSESSRLDTLRTLSREAERPV